ncbi:MAG: alpha/beta hydrolase [Microbacterium sp.]
MRDRSLTIPTRSGLTLAAHQLGDLSNPTALFLHGGGQTRFAWDKAMRRVAESGWSAVAADLRGHGESGWPEDGDYRIAAIADDVASCVEWLGSEPVLVGASLGGLASLYYLGEPEARGRALVLVDVVIEVAPEGAQHIRDFMLARPDGFASLDEASDAVAAYGATGRRPASGRGLLRNLRLGADGRYRWHWDPRLLGGPKSADVMRQTEELARRARRIDLPVLLIRGGASAVVSDRGVERLLDVLPRAEVVEVPDAGHMIAGDQNDRFAQEIIRFLDRIRGTGSEQS